MSELQVPLDDKLVRIDDPDFYLNDPYPVYKRMRNEDPVFWHESLKCWILSKQKDIRFVGSSDKFTAEKGVVIDHIKNGTRLEAVFPPGAELIPAMDPPRQKELRNIIAPALNMKAMKDLEPKIRAMAGDLLDKIPPGEAIDWMQVLAIPLPLLVISELLGLRELNLEKFKEWSDVFIARSGETTQAEKDHFEKCIGELWAFMSAEIEAKKAQPDRGGDLISLLVDADVSDATVLATCQLLLIAGNETTRNGLTAEMHLLAEHPDQYQSLLENPSLCASAVDETLRHFTVSMGFFRTALEDVELRGKVIKKGQPVYMFNPPANRDEEVYSNPDAFDVGRPRNHVAFGAGFHHCAGNLLARLEMRVVFEEVVKRFAAVEMAGDPRRVPSIVNNMYRALPVKLTAR